MNILHKVATAKKCRRKKVIRKAVSLLLVAELLLTQLAISSPALHHRLHGVEATSDFHLDHCATHHEESEADDHTDHVCAISLMAKGISGDVGTLEIHPSTAVNDPVPPSDPRWAEAPSLARPLARSPPSRFR